MTNLARREVRARKTPDLITPVGAVDSVHRSTHARDADVRTGSAPEHTIASYAVDVVTRGCGMNSCSWLLAWQPVAESICIRRTRHPASRRCSTLKYSRILAFRALRSRHIIRLGATTDFTTGCQRPDRAIRHITPGRGIIAGGVAHRSFMPKELALRALPSGRRAPGLMQRITRPGH